MIDRLTVIESDDIRKVMKIIDDFSGGVALLVDSESGSLRRVITDGDVRRLILKGANSNSNLAKLPHCDPIVAQQEHSIAEIKSLMQTHNVRHIPVVDNSGAPLRVFRRDELEKNVLLSPPHLGVDEMTFVTEAIETNWIAPAGPNLDTFEKEFCGRVGSKAAVAVSSGTAALHLSLILSGVKRGDLVACSSLTFVASANPILYLGAEPVFIDSENDGWNMCPLSLRLAFENARNSGKAIKVVVVANLYGQSARMDEISEVCRQFNAEIVEDSAESLGATYRGQASGTFGKFGIFSFNGNKIITTSGGGMLVSDDEEAIARAKFLSTQAKEPAEYYQHIEVGYNYRLSNILAGIGRAQLGVLQERINSRRLIFDRYVEGLSGLAIEWMPEVTNGFSTRWLSVGCFKEEYDVDISGFLETLSQQGIEARRIWKPMHLQPLFSSSEFYRSGDKDFAADLFRRGFCLPSGSSMTQGQQNRVISEVIGAFESNHY